MPRRSPSSCAGIAGERPPAPASYRLAVGSGTVRARVLAIVRDGLAHAVARAVGVEGELLGMKQSALSANRPSRVGPAPLAAQRVAVEHAIARCSAERVAQLAK